MTPLPRRSPAVPVALFALASLAGFLLAGPVARAVAGAGSGDAEVLRACYVPGSGVVYRIGADGLGDACEGKNHVEFSWNVQGPPGPRGPTGPQGPSGPGLTPQQCPTGEFVTGIAADGSLLCSGGSTGDPGDGGSATTWYRDADGDGWGVFDDTLEAVDAPAGYVAEWGDCDDTRSWVYPDAFDVQGDGVDADCDGYDGVFGDPAGSGLNVPTCPLHPLGPDVWFQDKDGDGYGDATSTTTSANQPEGYVATDCDCDDDDPTVYPGATEIVDGVDNDCNGETF